VPERFIISFFQMLRRRGYHNGRTKRVRQHGKQFWQRCTERRVPATVYGREKLGLIFSERARCGQKPLYTYLLRYTKYICQLVSREN